MGARVTETPRAAAEGADVIVATVADDAASQAVWLGASGTLAGAKSGAICAESSALSPDWVRKLAELAKARGCLFLDAPIGASRQAAAAGHLVFFVGGEADAVAEAEPALEAIATRVVHVGGTGAGASWKLINNMLIAAVLAAVAEALAWAKKAGFAADKASALISASSAASPIVKAKLERMIEGRFDDPDFALYLIHKDVRYGLALAESLGARHDMAAAAAAAAPRSHGPRRNGLRRRGCLNRDCVGMRRWPLRPHT
jgi:3-hydroxyisobutyrate dehydrogenase